jgi:NADH dehydrogenase/NADH:ubiquinone oxidoreductase subunit G
MISLMVNGLKVAVPQGTTVLEAARVFGFEIPTLCHLDGLSPYGACRLCVVEVGESEKVRLVSSCTYPVQDGLRVRTASPRVMRARRMILELLLASCPQSKQIHDLAFAYGIRKQRFHQEYEDCILCGLCVRICKEQMMAGAIAFRGRGQNRSIGTPFDTTSDVCRRCGGCIYVCPACQRDCTYNEPDKAICGASSLASPACLKKA